MEMTPEEIVRDYTGAKNPKAQIKILAELNACSTAEIAQVLCDAGKISAGTVGQYKRGNKSPDKKPAKKKKPDENKPSAPPAETTELIPASIRSIVEAWVEEHQDDYVQAKVFIAQYVEAEKWLA